jgi:hypothetical protein
MECPREASARSRARKVVAWPLPQELVIVRPMMVMLSEFMMKKAGVR